MNEFPVREITEDEIQAYQNDGVVCLRGLVDADWIEFLRQAIDANIAEPSRMALDLTRGQGGKFANDTFIWHHRPAFKRFVFESPAGHATAKVMGSPHVNILFDQMLVKEPGTGQRTLWHHDQPYWPIGGQQVCTLWLALDPVTNETGAVEYVKGSHRWGKRFKAVAFADDGLYKEDLPPVPDIDSMRDELEFVQYELAPGDCTIHHGLTVHGAPGNSSSTTRRRAYISRWAGQDATWYPRPNIQPMLWEPDLTPGGPIDSDLFPRVWPRAA